MGEADVQKALEQLVQLLDAHAIPYAIVGAMALNEFGYQRTTVDVDVLLTPEGLAAFKAHALGRGYSEKFPGSRGVRDTANRVDIVIVLTGAFPGDGKPKPVVFPDPATTALRGTRVALLPLTTLLELKLASGMTAPHRLKDLADVQELIRIQQLPRALVSELNVRAREVPRALAGRLRSSRRVGGEADCRRPVADSSYSGRSTSPRLSQRPRRSISTTPSAPRTRRHGFAISATDGSRPFVDCAASRS